MHVTLLGLMTLMAIPTIPPARGADTVTTGFLDRSVTVNGTAYPYQVYVPRDYDPDRRWPVILFLHGSGERGSDGLLQTEVGLGSAIRRNPERYPALVVMPQSPLETSWVGDVADAAMAALDATLAEFSADPDRVAVTGMSRGGHGAWYLAYHHPDRFAAVVPVCGWVGGRGEMEPIAPEGDAATGTDEGGESVYDRVARRIAHIPVWIFHGDQDTAVPVEESRRMAAALEKAGGDVRYTEIFGGNHNAWDPAYRSEALPAWIFGSLPSR